MDMEEDDQEKTEIKMWLWVELMLDRASVSGLRLGPVKDVR